MKKDINNNTFLIVVIIILVILIYVGSFGQINIVRSDVNDESENKLSNLKRRHRKLQELIEKKVDLNKRLNRKFKIIYFGVRLGFICVYALYNLSLYFLFSIKSVGNLLDWNEVALIVISICSFLAFGTFANLSKFIDDIKMKLEIRIYSKYENLNDEIGWYKKEENLLAQSIMSQEELIIKEKKDNIG